MKIKMENPVELYLKKYGIHGRSTKQLSNELNLPRKKVIYFIYTSKCVEDTNPYLHGSSKNKINVYNYNIHDKTYITRKHSKNKSKIILNEIKGDIN